MKKWLVIGNIQMMLLGAVLSVIELEKNTVGQENIIHIVKRNNIIKAMLKNIAFLDVYAKFSLKGVRMQRLKKAFLFILGLYIVPVFWGHISALIWGDSYFETFAGYFVVVYFLSYFLFYLLHKKCLLKRLSNKYVFYVILYFIFWILGIVLFVGYEI